MFMIHTLKYSFIATLFFLLTSCGNSSEKRAYIKSPVDNLITEYIDQQNFSVILADMNYDESTKNYFHKYRIIIPKTQNTSSEKTENDFEIVNTDWKKVTPITFEKHQNDLGMTILSKKKGVLDKKTAPAGYDNYVGNSNYGEWKTSSNGSSFWAFYGQYAFMRSMFGWGSGYRNYRSDYNDYGSYRGSRNFYGRNNTYGTKNYKNTNSTWAKKPASFKQRVQSNVKKSASSMRSSGYSSNRSYSNSTNKTTRTSNAYSSSSTRSRSGGFGK